MLIHDYLARSARLFPGKTALVCGGERTSYAALEVASSAFAAHLRTSGLRRGDRVLICLENSREAVAAIFGTLSAGGCIVVVNPTTPPERLGYLLEHSGARFVVCAPARAGAFGSPRGGGQAPPGVIVAGDGTLPAGAVSLAALLDGPRRDEPLPLISTDLAAIIYTSGSTGRPKGVTLTHLNIDTVCESVEEYLENSSDDVILSVLQLSFGYGLLQLLVTFRTGGTLVLEKGFGYPYDIVNTLKEQKITGFAGVPTLFALLLQLSTLGQERFPDLRYITNAAAAMPQSFIPRLRQLFPQTRIYLMHGLTEVLRTTYLPPDQLDTRPASVGRGMKNVELWIEDEDGKRLGPGEVGELVVRGANVMAGYWDDPEATSKVLLPGRYSWERVMHSGDLFTMDEEGYFSFVARKDDIIKCRGEKVSPLEVENVLYRLEGVLECRVIGVADPLLGQAVRAEIVLKPESSLVESAVRAHCRMHLEDYKVPQAIAFVDALPKTAGGKIRRTP